MREEGQAIFNTEAVCVLGPSELALAKQRAAESPTGRFRICLHRDPSEPVQEMVIASRRGSYGRPHRHSVPASYVALDGAGELLVFNDDGSLLSRMRLKPLDPSAAQCVRFEGGVWHAFRPLTRVAVVYETLASAFDPVTSNEWAPFAPDEDEPAAGNAWLDSLAPR
jgi:cupin fold WbuC family metalloprotein